MSHDKGVIGCNAGFPIPLSKPDVRLSPHPAFPSSVHLSFQTEQPLHFADIHGYDSATWLLGYFCLGPSDELPPFPLWPAFPTSEYYGGSDAQHDPWQTACLDIPCRASHVHADGFYAMI